MLSIQIWTDFHENEAKKNFIKKKIGLVGLIDAKGIDVAQPIYP